MPPQFLPQRPASAYRAAVILCAVVAVTSAARADWPPEGLKVCRDFCGDAATPVTDDAGGAFVVWRDYLSGAGTTDIYMQRITAAGENAPGWLSGELPICTEQKSQHYSDFVADGSGGAIVVWSDFRSEQGPTGPDVFAQRVLADGSLAPGWAVNGMPVAKADGYQWAPVAVGDGTGGAFVSWDNLTGSTYNNICLQRIGADGVPAPGWPQDGMPICVLPSGQSSPTLVADGMGGVIIAWGDGRDGVYAAYAQRVTADGQILWAENGVRVVLGRAIRNLATDGAGGAYLSCATLAMAQDQDYYLQRFTADGTIAPGWPEGGVLVCTAPEERAGIRMVADGTGGALMAWYDYRDVSDDEIFVQRIRPDGLRYPGWPVNGLRLTDNAVYDNTPDLAPDGLGGAYVSWERISAALGQRIVVQHVSGLAQVMAGWPAGGSVTPGTETQSFPRVIADGAGGAIVTWNQCCSVWAQRFVTDGPVAVELSLARVEAEPNRVFLLWQGPGAGALAATVERRGEVEDWITLGPAARDGTDRLRYEDRSVLVGERYAYRLVYADESLEQRTPDVWVEVPPALELALEGFRPNPVVGAPLVAFTLPTAAPARLEVLDVAGRRLLARDVGSLGPGHHTVALNARARWEPGVYLIRLTSAERTLHRRGIVVR